MVMLVYARLQYTVGPARSQPKNCSKCLISLIIDVVEPPKPKGGHPVMSADLERALSTIQKGAEERLEILKSQKQRVEQGETSGGTVLKLIRHIEKLEPGDEQGDEEDTSGAVGEKKDVGGRQTADEGGTNGKSVKLTRRRETDQIMWPVNSI